MSTLSQFLNPSIGTTNVGNFRLFDSSGTVTVPSSAVYIAYAALGGGSTAHSLATQTVVTPFPSSQYAQNRILASGSGGGFSYNDGSISIPAPITATVTVGASGNSTGGTAGNTTITGIPLGSIAGNGGAPGNTGGGSSSGGIINNSGGNGDGFTLATGPSGSPGLPAYANAFAYSGGGAGGLYSSGGNGTGLEISAPLTTLYNTINNAVGGGGAGGSGGGTGGHLQSRSGMPGLVGSGGRGTSSLTTPVTNVTWNQAESGTPGYIMQYNSRGNFSQLKTFFAAAGGGGAGGGSSANNLAIVSAGHGGAGGGGGAFTFGGSPSVYGSAGDGGFMGGGGIGGGSVGGANLGGAANNFSGNGGRGGGGGTSYMYLASLTPSSANTAYQTGGFGGKGVAGIEWWVT